MIRASHHVLLGVRQHNHVACTCLEALSLVSADPALAIGNDVEQD